MADALDDGDDYEIGLAKKAMRAEMQRRLHALDDATLRRGSRAASDRLMEMDEVRDAGTVLFFMAMKAEIDTGRVMEACLKDGISVAVPRIDEASRELEAIEIESLDERFFDRDRFGILTPRGGRRVRATELDAVIVPGLAFDRAGRRLGRGAGYYDRMLIRLTERCATIGVGFAFQLVDRVPCEAHDQCVQRVATDRELVEVG